MTRKLTLASLFLFLVLSLGAPTAQMAQPAQPEDSTVVYLPLMAHNVMEPVVAFATDRDGNFEIYTLNPWSLAMRNVTNNGAQDMAPAFGPRGRLAWASTRDGNWEIYVGHVLGRAVRRLTFDAAIDFDPTWSPDGVRIAYTSGRSGNMDIRATNADGSGGEVRLTNLPSQQRQPAWSPSGNLIAYVSDEDGNDNIFVMNADGSEKTRVRDMASSHEQFPTWSPDGKWILFTTDLDGPYQLYAYHVDQQTLQPVIATPVFDAEGSWSRDGRWVVFRSTRGDNTDLYLINFEGVGLGTGLRRLTTHAADDIQPAWLR